MISPYGRPGTGKGVDAPRSAGFTLIEMMVVTLIIGVMATFVALSIGNRSIDDRMEVESKRIVALAGLARDEADMKGIPIGLSFGPNGYTFLAIDKNKHWAQYTGSDVLRARTLSEPFYTELRVEDQAVPPAASGTDPDKVVPQILLMPGGDVTVFSLDLYAPGDRTYVHIEADPQGKISREVRQVSR